MKPLKDRIDVLPIADQLNSARYRPGASYNDQGEIHRDGNEVPPN